ncbi:MAG: hypothetical protein KBG48_34720 [Kofleriaceae bacterium]|jgi:hypothetical protein|nr:hypothetical protein [Kofleriaceae bacterium]MBP9172567.1 hypothetical protein [Kofleriaceae bacterium]MBP9861884.1 hypothetical protein [Kofleriaceae bacterium]
MDRKHDDTELDTPAVETEAPVETGPHDAIMARVHALTAADHEALARYIHDFPQLRDEILAWANQHLGNHVVQQALGTMPEAAAEAKEDEAFADEVMAQMGRDKDDAEFQAYMMGAIAATDRVRGGVADPTYDPNAEERQLELAPGQCEAYFTGYMSVRPEDVKPIQDEGVATEEEGEKQEVVAAVEQMTEDDSALLGATMAEHPEARAEIMAEAMPVVGEAVVAEAVTIETEEVKEEPAAEVAVEAEAAEAEVSEETDEKPTHSRNWVRGAQRYNARHSEMVAEFVQLTGAPVAEDGTVDPNFVAAWQTENGVSPDGRIGPLTVTAAREGANNKPKVTPALVESCIDNPLDNACLA